MRYLGDFAAAAIVRFMWGTADSTGASVTRATNGTISVYKDSSDTQSTTGVTDSEDVDGLTGIHRVAIDTSADGTFYSAGSDFMVVLSAATIDGKVVNAVLAQFSLQNRYPSVAAMQSGLATAANLATVAGYLDTEIADIKAKTDNLPASPAAVGSAMTLAAGAITAAVIATDAIDADAIAADAVTEIGGDANAIADAILDRSYVGHTLPSTLGKVLNGAGGVTQML